MPERSARERGRVELSPKGPRDARRAELVWNSMVVPGRKVVFVNVSKNASTSLKWLTAELSGQDPAAFHSLMGFAPTRQQTIHRRAAWVDVPRLADLPAAERAEISPERGWFVFGIVRDPRLRVWSAWQSKFLVGNPRHAWQMFRDAPWLPRVPRSADDVVEDFTTFVRELEGEDGEKILDDSHFRPQTRLLQESVVPYTHLYEPSGLPLLLDDLRAHLEAQGLPGEHTLSRENETPLTVSGRVFTPEVVEILERVYASDLKRFGHLWDFDAVLATERTWAPESFLDISGRVAAGQRIADLARGAADLQDRLRETEREDRRTIDRLTRQVADLEAALERRSLRGFPRAAVSRVRRTILPSTTTEG
jgi:hypothetical protein